MLAHRKDIRIWSITVTWKNYTQQLRKEFIVTAPDEDTAKQLVTNRLPTHLLSQPDKHGQIRVREARSIITKHTSVQNRLFQILGKTMRPNMSESFYMQKCGDPNLDGDPQTKRPHNKTITTCKK